ncbi:MAG: DUF1656 domain-containing protein [Verrucomicrobia bacterium]|nr:MAG: DUF1656 domain-containing protein [Verrucomicrobiota bacterium]
MNVWIIFPLLLVLLTMTGCDPQINIAGAYFPAWLLSGLVALAAFWILHLIFLRTKMIPFFVPIPLFYAALYIALTCGCWLLFFAAR